MSYSQTSSCIASVRVRTLFENYEVKSQNIIVQDCSNQLCTNYSNFWGGNWWFCLFTSALFAPNAEVLFFSSALWFSSSHSHLQIMSWQSHQYDLSTIQFCSHLGHDNVGSPQKNPASSSHVPFNGHTLWLSPILWHTQTPSCYRLKSPIFVCWYSHIMWGWIKTHIAIWPGRWTSITSNLFWREQLGTDRLLTYSHL
jgi:hypothetical protein